MKQQGEQRPGARRPAWLTDDRIVEAYNDGHPPLSARSVDGTITQVGIHSSCWLPFDEVREVLERRGERRDNHDPGDEDRS